MKTRRKISCVAISGSAGAIDVLTKILPGLDPSIPFSVVCVLHMAPDSKNLLVPIFADKCKCLVKEAESTESLQPGTVYFGPPDFHLSFEKDRSFSISNEPPVHFSRPSLDVFLSSAAESLGHEVCAILLSGANHDGALGLSLVGQAGGLTIVQDPQEALHPTMPQQAIEMRKPDLILKTKEILQMLQAISKQGGI